MSRLLIIQHDSVFEQYGGIQYYLDDFVKLCRNELGGESVRTLAPQRSEKLQKTPDEYDVDFVRLAKKGLIAKVQNRFPAPLYARAMELVEEFQPTHLIASHVSLGPLCFALHLRTKLPYFTIVYGTDCWGDLWPQDEWCLRRADGILSISHWTKNVLSTRGISPEKIHILHPMLDERFMNVPVKQASQVKRSDKAFTLLTVSRLDAKESYKGQDHVLQALRLLIDEYPDYKLRYIVQGEGTDLPRLKNLTEQLGLGEFVEFRGRVNDRAELDKLYAECDLFIMPSRFGKWDGAWRGEGFGIVYVEAAAFGVPSIAYRCGGVMDIIENGVNGLLVEQDSIEGLADAISSLVENPDYLMRLGENAAELCRKKFSRKAVAAELKEVF